MKLNFVFAMIALWFTAIWLTACQNGGQQDLNYASASTANNKNTASVTDQQFKDYWYKGEAEITSYKLSQARYGKNHEGNVVLVYVTEPFNAQKQVKSDSRSEQNVPIMKLNQSKKFLTGIYPYSVMTSIFSPVNPDQAALKTTFSSQEWCGQSFVQLNNRKKFEVLSRSYFEYHGDEFFKLNKDFLEDDMWVKIRVAPKQLPTGKIKMIPALEYLTLFHKKVQAYEAEAKLEQNGEWSIYQIKYPQLGRTLEITFQSKFPYTIEGWEEARSNNNGSGGFQMVTKAKKIKRIKSDYWNKNTPQDARLHRELLGKQ